MDCSGAEGEEAMRAAGATEEAVRYAQHDGEYRTDGAVGDEFLHHDETGGLRMPRSAAVHAGDTTLAKRLYGGSMPPGARDEIIEWAARCEGWDAAMRGGADGTGRALRVPWHETMLMSAGATRSLAHMSLTLHEEYDFTDACATDGSFIKATADERSRASYGWWRGVRADGSADGDGGALPIGGNVQDAEMLGIGSPSAWQWRASERQQRRGERHRGCW